MNLYDSLKRQSYLSHTSLTSAVREHNYTRLQLKYDGIWSKLHVLNSGMTIWKSRTNEIKHQELTNLAPGIYIGEYMFGSNWAQHHERIGKTFLFDIVWDGNSDLRSLEYARRYSILADRVQRQSSDKLCLVANIDIKLAKACWQRVESQKYEGLVFRRKEDDYFSTLGRLKRTIEIEYIALDLVEGTNRLTGTLGSIVAGLYKKGECVEVCKVGGGLSDDQRRDIWSSWPRDKGRVFTAKGNVLFSSGALRHPNFITWRDDKKDIECIMENLS